MVNAGSIFGQQNRAAPGPKTPYLAAPAAAFAPIARRRSVSVAERLNFEPLSMLLDLPALFVIAALALAHMLLPLISYRAGFGIS